MNGASWLVWAARVTAGELVRVWGKSLRSANATESASCSLGSVDAGQAEGFRFMEKRYA